MTENTDCLWDDGVAPELALDFDAPNVSSREAVWTLLGVLAGFGGLLLAVRAATPADGNPALPHATDNVVPDDSIMNHTAAATKKK